MRHFEPCLCGAEDCPSCFPGRAARRYPLGSLSAEDIDILNVCTRAVPLYSESGTYREWEITVDGTRYCIVDEDSVWTLLVSCDGDWLDAPDDVAEFLRTHNLILAA